MNKCFRNRKQRWLPLQQSLPFSLLFPSSHQPAAAAAAAAAACVLLDECRRHSGSKSKEMGVLDISLEKYTF